MMIPKKHLPGAFLWHLQKVTAAAVVLASAVRIHRAAFVKSWGVTWYSWVVQRLLKVMFMGKLAHL